MAVAEAVRGFTIPVRRERNPWADAFYELLRNRVAMAGGLFMILIILAAIFADLVAPYAYAEVHFKDNYAPPNTTY